MRPTVELTRRRESKHPSRIRKLRAALPPLASDLLCPSCPIFEPLEYFYKVPVFDVRDVDTIGIPDSFVQMFVGFLSVKIPQSGFVGYEAFAIVHIQHSAEEIVGDVVEGTNTIRGSKFNGQTCAGSR